MKVLEACFAVAMAAAVMSLSACGGGGADIETTTKTTTKGQELLDLQDAYESGAISEQEYNDQRQDILDAD